MFYLILHLLTSNISHHLNLTLSVPIFYTIQFCGIDIYSFLLHFLLQYANVSYSILWYCILSHSIVSTTLLFYSILLYYIYFILFYTILLCSILFYFCLLFPILSYFILFVINSISTKLILTQISIHCSIILRIFNCAVHDSCSDEVSIFICCKCYHNLHQSVRKIITIKNKSNLCHVVVVQQICSFITYVDKDLR